MAFFFKNLKASKLYHRNVEILKAYHMNNEISLDVATTPTTTYSQFSNYATPNGFTALNLNIQQGGRNYGRPAWFTESDIPTVVQKLLNAVRGCSSANTQAKVFYKHTVTGDSSTKENFHPELVCGDHGNASSGIIAQLPILEFIEELIYWDVATSSVKHIKRRTHAINPTFGELQFLNDTANRQASYSPSQGRGASRGANYSDIQRCNIKPTSLVLRVSPRYRSVSEFATFHFNDKVIDISSFGFRDRGSSVQLTGAISDRSLFDTAIQENFETVYITLANGNVIGEAIYSPANIATRNAYEDITATSDTIPNLRELPPPPPVARLYMVGNNNEVLYTVNPSTGVATRVGSASQFGVNENVPSGLASHNGTLYMIGGSDDLPPTSGALYTVNPSTGVATRVGSTGNFFTTITPAGFASHNGTLYMVSASGAFYTINETTGRATRQGSTGQFGVNELFPSGLASHNGTLYMVGNNNEVLYTVNPSTGVATRVGSATDFGVGLSSPQGLTSHNGTLYMVGNGNLYTLNISTGVATRVGSAISFGVGERDPTGLASHVS